MNKSRTRSRSTTVILFPKVTSARKRKSTIGRRRGTAAQVKEDIKKAVKESRSEHVPRELQINVERHIRKLTKEQDADLRVFKAVATFMFKDPHFAALIEQRYGVTIGKGLRAYLRTVGIILEAVLGTWISVAGVFSIALTITKFIFHVVWFACIMTIRVVNGLGFLPNWLSQRIATAKKQRHKQVVLRIVSK